VARVGAGGVAREAIVALVGVDELRVGIGVALAGVAALLSLIHI